MENIITLSFAGKQEILYKNYNKLDCYEFLKVGSIVDGFNNITIHFDLSVLKATCMFTIGEDVVSFIGTHNKLMEYTGSEKYRCLAKYYLRLVYNTLSFAMQEKLTVEEIGRRAGKGSITKGIPLPSDVENIIKRSLLGYKSRNNENGLTHSRPYTKPNMQVQVKGHVRHYKNGKIVYVDAYTKYKEKEKNNAKRIYKY